MVEDVCGQRSKFPQKKGPQGAEQQPKLALNKHTTTRAHKETVLGRHKSKWHAIFTCAVARVMFKSIQRKGALQTVSSKKAHSSGSRATAKTSSEHTRRPAHKQTV